MAVKELIYQKIETVIVRTCAKSQITRSIGQLKMTTVR